MHLCTEQRIVVSGASPLVNAMGRFSYMIISWCVVSNSNVTVYTHMRMHTPMQISNLLCTPWSANQRWSTFTWLYLWLQLYAVCKWPSSTLIRYTLNTIQNWRPIWSPVPVMSRGQTHWICTLRFPYHRGTFWALFRKDSMGQKCSDVYYHNCFVYGIFIVSFHDGCTTHSKIIVDSLVYWLVGCSDMYLAVLFSMSETRRLVHILKRNVSVHTASTNESAIIQW